MNREPFFIPIGIPAAPGYPGRLSLVSIANFLFPVKPSYTEPMQMAVPGIQVSQGVPYTVCHAIKGFRDDTTTIESPQPFQRPAQRRILLQMPQFDYKALDDRG